MELCALAIEGDPSSIELSAWGIVLRLLNKVAPCNEPKGAGSRTSVILQRTAALAQMR